MGRPLVNLTDKVFGMMTVLARDFSKPSGSGKAVYWQVLCACGNLASIRTDALRKQNSCGCKKGVVDGYRTSSIMPQNMYWRWTNMMRRCYSPGSEKDYRLYKARGITVCNRWQNPLNFWEDMGNPPFEGATLDRIDNDGNYGPGNVRWATWSEQNKNRRPFGAGNAH